MVTTRLREILSERGLRQDWLAAKVGVHPTTMSALVNGRRIPTLEVALRIAHVLGVPVEEIWRYEDD